MKLNKKSLFIGVLFLLSISTISADDLANLLQDLAVQTACLGMYSTAQTGVYVTSRYDDPPDWYDPPMMANRFAAMSGNMTRIETFYGVCFDYAQFAWNDIKKYQKLYNDAGMKGQQWYIAVANVGNPNTIILYDPLPEGRKNEATIISNGIYLKENSRHRVYAHDGATGHAWLWVQHNNSTWYWIDPTWTDNKGYPWWGIVQSGKEVQFYPNSKYCVANNYPRPPRPNETPIERETRSPNSVYDTYTPAGSPGAEIGLYFGYISSFDFDNKSFDFDNKFGFSLALEDCLPTYEYGLVGSLSLDYIKNNKEKESMSALLIGFTLGFQFFNHFVIYAGGGIGTKFPDFTWKEWKVNGGLRVHIKWFFTKFDVSYNPIIGPAFSVGLGIIPKLVGI